MKPTNDGIDRLGYGMRFWGNEKQELHREDDLPAVIYPDDRQEWWINGMLHRLYAPAMLSPYGDEYWYINGNKITNKVNEFIIEYELPPWQEWTDEHKILFRMRF